MLLTSPVLYLTKRIKEKSLTPLFKIMKNDQMYEKNLVFTQIF